MDFISAWLLVVLWYVRPQDIFSIIAGVSLVKYLMYVGIVVTIRRERGFGLSEVLRVPIDYIVAGYCLWAIYVTPDHTAASKEVFTYFAFHVVTALAITSWKKFEFYLDCWMTCLAVVALLAVSGAWGFELVKGSQELTAAFHDRLTLNTWIFRNPNALGHGVVALVPAGLSWYLFSGGRKRLIGAVFIFLVVHCLMLTESKGAYMAGAGALTLVVLFRRPLFVQLAVLALASGIGVTALKALPRMNTLSKNDEGIQGRMIVWQQAMKSMEGSKTGEGLKAFEGFVPVRVTKLHRTVNIPIATHGSYVRHGADLGYVGLMLYCGIFYAGARIVIQATCSGRADVIRVQRTLFALVVTMALSSFICDRAYHMDFFLLSGLLSAFHRKVIGSNREDDLDDAVALTTSIVPSQDPSDSTKSSTVLEKVVGASVLGEEKHDFSLNWHRVGLVDLLAMYVLLQAVLYYWDLFSTDFIVF